MNLSNISFGKKIAGAFGLVLVMLLAISLISLSAHSKLTAQTNAAKSANQLALLFSGKLTDHLEWVNTLNRFLINPENRQLQLETDDHRCKLGQWLYGEDRKLAIARFPGTAVLFSKLEAPHHRLHASAVAIGRAYENTENLDSASTQAKKIYRTETVPALEEIRSQMRALQALLVKTANTSEVQRLDLAAATRQNIVIISLVAIAMGIVCTVAMSRYVAVRVRKLMQFAETIADGDFTATMESQAEDELGRLAAVLNDMRRRLGTLLTGFADGVAHLSASSRELFSTSKDMADGSVNMSERSFAVAAAAEEMSANMNSVAAASEEAATNINMVAAAAEELTSTVGEIARSSESARTISDEAVSTANHASTRVNELGDAAAQISKVTEVITEISEQTNLLALNATIEAARAGEAGKGFAVVANEIKDLARQTAEATQSIKSEIEGVQKTTHSAVDEITQITDVINRVNDIVASIAGAVEEQSSTTQEIAANVAQASEGIQEVNVNVSQSSATSTEIARDISVVSQVAGNLSDSSATVSANAGELSGFTTDLKGMVGEFRLPANISHDTNARTTTRQVAPVADLIRWNDGYTVNITQFDDQHKKLVGLINKLHRAMKRRQAGHVVGTILADLVSYTQEHFKAEENAMRQYGYPGLAEQERQHQKLIEQVAASQEKLTSGDMMLSMEVMDFLKDWLVNHIQGSDKKYGPFLNEKGLT